MSAVGKSVVSLAVAAVLDEGDDLRLCECHS